MFQYIIIILPFIFFFYRGVHVLQPKAYTENCTILGPEIMVEIVDDRILLPPSPEEVNFISLAVLCWDA